MPLDSQCIFCRIVAGQAEASRVYRDPLVTAFLDIHPVTPGHLLVVPNSHFPDLAGLDAQYAAQMMATGRRLAAVVRTVLKAEGVNLLVADGAAAGQSVFHCHLHVIPRKTGDGFGFRRAFGAGGAERGELERIAEQLRPSMESGVA